MKFSSAQRERAAATVLAACLGLAAVPASAARIGGGGDLERYAGHLVAGRRMAEHLYAVRVGSFRTVDGAVAAAERLRELELPFFVRLPAREGQAQPDSLEILVVSRADSASAGAIAARLLYGGMADEPVIEVGWPEDLMRGLAVLLRLAVLEDGTVIGAEMLQPMHPALDHTALSLARARKLHLSGVPRTAIIVLPLLFSSP